MLSICSSGAALGIIHRKGLGKTRHIDISCLWVQEVAAQRRLIYTKVLGKENQADLYIKHFDVATMDKHVNKLDCRYKIGRASAAPELHILSKSWSDYVSEQSTQGERELEEASPHILMNVTNGYDQRTKVGRVHVKKISNKVDAKGQSEQIQHQWKSSRMESIQKTQKVESNTESWNAHNVHWRRKKTMSTNSLQYLNRLYNYTTQPYTYNWSRIKNSTTIGQRSHSLPIRMEDVKHLRSATTASYDAIVGRGIYSHDHTTTVSVTAVENCTGMLCPQSSTSADASGHRLRGGSRTYRETYTYRQANLLFNLLSKHDQSCGCNEAETNLVELRSLPM